MHQIRFPLGLPPDTAGELAALPRPPELDLSGPTSKGDEGRERKGERERTESEERERKENGVRRGKWRRGRHSLARPLA